MTRSQEQRFDRYMRCLKWTLTVAIFWFILSRINYEALQDTVRRVQISFYLIAIAMSFVNSFILSLAVSTILKGAAHPIAWLKVVKINYVSTFFSLMGDVTGGVVRWHALSGETKRRGEAFFAMVVERCQIIIVHMGLTLWLWQFKPTFFNPAETQAFITILLVIAGVLVMGVICSISQGIRQKFDQLLGVLRPRLVFGFAQDRLRDLVRVVLGFKSRPRFYWWSQGVMVAYVLASFLTIMIVFKVAGITLPILDIMWVFAVLNLVEQFPLTIRGMGVREGVLIYLLSKYGIILEVGLTAGLLISFLSIVHAMVGGVWYLAGDAHAEKD